MPSVFEHTREKETKLHETWKSGRTDGRMDGHGDTFKSAKFMRYVVFHPSN